MTMELTKIYAGLKAWRDERRITPQSQKLGYLVNVMEEIGELSEGMRKDSKNEIVDALCDIAVFTINTFDDEAPTLISLARSPINKNEWLGGLLVDIGRYSSGFDYDDAHNVLSSVIELCKYYGYDFSIAMSEVIKEINSRTGSYDEQAQKWVKDKSPEAQAKWYKADFEKARLK